MENNIPELLFRFYSPIPLNFAVEIKQKEQQEA